MMRKETENMLTTFENQNSIVKNVFDTSEVKARGINIKYIVILNRNNPGLKRNSELLSLLYSLPTDMKKMLRNGK